MAFVRMRQHKRIKSAANAVSPAKNILERTDGTVSYIKENILSVR